MKNAVIKGTVQLKPQRLRKILPIPILPQFRLTYEPLNKPFNIRPIRCISETKDLKIYPASPSRGSSALKKLTASGRSVKLQRKKSSTS